VRVRFIKETDLKKSRFNEAQIIGVLREQEARSPTAEVCRRHGISEQTFYRWKTKYNGDDGVRRHEAEGAGGREPTAEEAAGGIDAGCVGAERSSGKKLIGPVARRAAVLRLMAERGFSQKRTCGLVQIDPKTVRREPEQSDAEVRERLRSLAAERRQLSAPGHPAGAGERQHEQEAAVPALSGGRPRGATTTRPQAGYRNPYAHGPASLAAIGHPAAQYDSCVVRPFSSSHAASHN